MIFGVQGFRGSRAPPYVGRQVGISLKNLISNPTPRTLEPSDPQIADGENYAPSIGSSFLPVIVLSVTLRILALEQGTKENSLSRQIHERTDSKGR
jgi:hypothetical protein